MPLIDDIFKCFTAATHPSYFIYRDQEDGTTTLIWPPGCGIPPVAWHEKSEKTWDRNIEGSSHCTKVKSITYSKLTQAHVCMQYIYIYIFELHGWQGAWSATEQTKNVHKETKLVVSPRQIYMKITGLKAAVICTLSSTLKDWLCVSVQRSSSYLPNMRAICLTKCVYNGQKNNWNSPHRFHLLCRKRCRGFTNRKKPNITTTSIPEEKPTPR